MIQNIVGIVNFIYLTVTGIVLDHLSTGFIVLATTALFTLGYVIEMSAELVARMIDFQDKLIRFVKQHGEISMLRAYQLGDEYGLSGESTGRSISIVVARDQPLQVIRRKDKSDWIAPR